MKRALLAVGVLAALALIVATAWVLAERRRTEAARQEEEARRARTFEQLRIVKELIAAGGATTDDYPPLAGGDAKDDNGQGALQGGMAHPGEGPFLDGWGRPLVYRRPGPIHRDGWDVFSVADMALSIGESYTPPPRPARVDDLYTDETLGRLAELHDIVVKLPRKPESDELRVLFDSLLEAGLIDRHGRARFMDQWGHRLRWACPGNVHPKGWDLYSIGPNGEDELGAGDDLVTGEDSR